MTTRPASTEPVAISDHEALVALLDEVAATAADAPCWPVLSGRARALTRNLAAAGQLPPSLVVSTGDTPIVVARTLLRAARFPSGAGDRQRGGAPSLEPDALERAAAG